MLLLVNNQDFIFYNLLLNLHCNKMQIISLNIWLSLSTLIRFPIQQNKKYIYIEQQNSIYPKYLTHFATTYCPIPNNSFLFSVEHRRFPANSTCFRHPPQLGFPYRLFIIHRSTKTTRLSPYIHLLLLQFHVY